VGIERYRRPCAILAGLGCSAGQRRGEVLGGRPGGRDLATYGRVTGARLISYVPTQDRRVLLFIQVRAGPKCLADGPMSARHRTAVFGRGKRTSKRTGCGSGGAQWGGGKTPTTVSVRKAGAAEGPLRPVMELAAGNCARRFAFLESDITPSISRRRA
jgi:hypothetical protein